MRWFDELVGFKHSPGLMEPLRFFTAALVVVVTLNATAQDTNVVTNTPAAGSAYTNAQLAATPPGRNTRMFTLADAIRMSLHQNLDIQMARLNPLTNGYAIDIAFWGAYEPVAGLTAGKSYSDRPGGLNPETGQPFGSSVSEQDTYSPSIKGAFPYTGLTYELSGNLARNSILNPSNPAHWFAPQWESEPGPGITLDQPLLRNFWMDNNRLSIKLAKDNLKISEQALRLQVMQTVTAVMTNYYGLLYARGNVDAQATALKLAQQLVSENLKRVEVGTLAPLDEKQSESQAAASLASLHQAQQALVIQENQFKFLLTSNYYEWSEITPVPTEQLVAVPQELNLQESWKRALTQRPEYIQQKIFVEKQNVTLKYQFNQIFPQLDITGSYGRNAFDRSFSSALTDLREGNASYYSYGVLLSIPLGGNVAARNTYKSGKATLKQILLQLKQTEENIMVEVDNDVGQVRSSLQQVYATRDARIYAEDALAAERKKLENGKSTSFVVLQLISNLTTARVNEIQALSSYNNAVAQLALDEGNTLNENHIDITLK